MRQVIFAASAAAVLLSGCGYMRESKLNPLNWFGKSEPREAIALVATPQDARDLVADVVSLEVLPYSTGTIVQATGIAATQGYWDAELVAKDIDENGVLVYEFRVFPPAAPAPAGAAQTREIAVAATINNVKLDSVREIVVQGANNARSVRR